MIRNNPIVSEAQQPSHWAGPGSQWESLLTVIQQKGARDQDHW